MAYLVCDLLVLYSIRYDSATDLMSLENAISWSISSKVTDLILESRPLLVDARTGILSHDLPPRPHWVCF